MLTAERLDFLGKLKARGITEEEFKAVPLVKPVYFAEDDPARSLLRFMKNIDNIAFTSKHLFGLELLYHQVPIVQHLQKYKFPLLLGSRGLSKTMSLAFYALYTAVFNQGCKIILTGAGFRQARLIMEYIVKIVEGAPILRSMFGNDIYHKGGNDRSVFTVGQSQIIAIPMGDGSTIRGLRAQIVIVDEFASIQRDIFEIVIRGFGVVAQNPVEEIENRARIAVLQEHGMWSAELEEAERKLSRGNQLIIAGTASWQTNHFYEYYQEYKTIIETAGDDQAKRLSGLKGKTDPRDYCVIRIPWHAAPVGYYDEGTIEAARSSNSELNFNMEYECVFPADSAGFFPHSLVEGCTTHRPLIPYETTEEVQFTPLQKGREGFNYIIGVDPAHSDDSLAIVVLEIHPTHRRVVHCWTINKDAFRERERSLGEDQSNYYAFCARKIRTLMKIFPISLIAMDAQGGGAAMLEALGDKSKLEEGESPILPIVQGHPLHSGKIHPDEDKSGLHIVEMVQFRDLIYTRDANVGLRKDMEDKALIFPYFDQGGSPSTWPPTNSSSPPSSTPMRISATNRGVEERTQDDHHQVDRHGRQVGHARLQARRCPQGTDAEGSLLRPPDGRHGGPANGQRPPKGRILLRRHVPVRIRGRPHLRRRPLPGRPPRLDLDPPPRMRRRLRVV